MYAIIQVGSQQFKVAEGDFIELNKLSNKEGEKLIFSNVLLLDDDKEVIVGNPYIEGAKVTGVVVSHLATKKIKVLRFRAKSRTRRKKGYRVRKTRVEIKKIESLKKTKRGSPRTSSDTQKTEKRVSPRKSTGRKTRKVNE